MTPGPGQGQRALVFKLHVDMSARSLYPGQEDP